MGRRNMLRVPGHAIVAEGDAHDDDGKLLPPGAPWSQVAGRAKCTCRLLSDPLPSKQARLRWHLYHREALLNVPWR
jgi:hypothetical protein